MLIGSVQDPCQRPRSGRHTGSDSGSYAAFLVRLWQDGSQAAWRASAQSTHSGDIVRFADVQALFAFLLAHTEPAAPRAPQANVEDSETR